MGKTLSLLAGGFLMKRGFNTLSLFTEIKFLIRSIELKNNFLLLPLMVFREKVFHKEENCLNCDYPLVGSFCGNCGQKAFLHKDSFWHMVVHFAGDYFHYDSKFWRTFKTLFTKPGLATLEYINGKRAKYLNPIQLYIFVTTVFFLFLFTGDDHIKKGDSVKVNRDSLRTLIRDSMRAERLGNAQALKDSGKVDRYSIDAGDNLSFKSPEGKDFSEYDSIQQTLPVNRRDGRFERYMTRKMYTLEEKYPDDTIADVFKEKFVHNFPKVFFLLLPFFALLLHMMFRRSKMYYVDHLIFSIHFHSFIFINLIILSLVSFIHIKWLVNLLGFALFFGLGIYLLFSFRRVYPSPWWKLILKQLFLTVMYIAGFTITAILLVFFTFIIM